MARYIPGMNGPLVGSIGNQCFSKNRYGFYVKSKPIPTNPNTPAQAEIRTALTQLVAYWKNTLTAVQAAAWEHAGQLHKRSKWGYGFTLSGINLFIAVNTLRLIGAQAIVDEPTIFNGSPPIVEPTIIDVVASGKKEISAWDETDVNLQLWVYSTDAVPVTTSYKNAPFVWRRRVTVGGGFPVLIDVAYPGSGETYKIFTGYKVQDIRGAISEKIQSNYSGTII